MICVLIRLDYYFQNMYRYRLRKILPNYFFNNYQTFFKSMPNTSKIHFKPRVRFEQDKLKGQNTEVFKYKITVY